jgi:hypothetical protein
MGVSMSNKQTAVDFAVEKLEKLIPSGNELVIGIILELAKEIFEQQIIDACNQTEFVDDYGMGFYEDITKGEQYYKETFKTITN